MDAAKRANKAIDEQLGPRGDGLPSSNWPAPPAPEAFYGLAGEAVRLIEPQSEADPVALLVQTHIAFGSVAGRSPHFWVEGDQHHTNLFAVIVGETSKARKGVSMGRVRQVLRLVDADWERFQIKGGLSSGEGLIFEVRDPIWEMKKERDLKTRETVEKEVLVDPGALDKRLLVFEGEFSQVLKVLRREGNILSAVVRQSWDTGNLRTLTKNDRVQATDAHVSLIAHIARAELLRYLDENEYANGFGNRFLWLCAKRSKVLPEGGTLTDAEMEPVARRVAEAVAFAAGVSEMHRDEEARRVWASVYPQLSEGRPGLAGSLLARAEAQVLRLSMVYALMDKSALIRAEHLMAALALWDYVQASVRYIFSDRTGDSTADTILKALREAGDRGLTRTDISDIFGHHTKTAEISRALTMLEALSLARHVVEQTPGRFAERWCAV